MWASVRGALNYCRLALLRRPGGGAIYLSMAGVGALVWVGVAVRQAARHEVQSVAFANRAFDTATIDLMILAAAVATVQTTLVAARLSRERAPEVRTFVVLGIPVRLLLLARTWELWIQGAAGALFGVVGGCALLVLGAGWHASLAEVLWAAFAALGVPILAMTPVTAWTWWRVSRG